MCSIPFDKTFYQCLKSLSISLTKISQDFFIVLLLIINFSSINFLQPRALVITRYDFTDFRSKFSNLIFFRRNIPQRSQRECVNSSRATPSEAQLAARLFFLFNIALFNFLLTLPMLFL